MTAPVQTKVHMAASYQTGDPDEKMVVVTSKVCVTCGGIIDPIVGKVHEGTTIRWDVWTGAWEHRSRPKVEHPAVPWLPKED